MASVRPNKINIYASIGIFRISIRFFRFSSFSSIYIFFLIFIYKQRKIYALFMIARHVIRMLIDKYLEIY